MTTDASTPKGARIAGIVLAALAGLLWIFVAPNLAGLGNSDPAGNAMAIGFAGLGLIVLWLLLSILALVAGLKGVMPARARPALLLVPASGIAAMAALELLSRPGTAPYHWPMLIPAFAPPLIITYCVWALVVPPMRARPAAAFLGAIGVLTAAIVPLYTVRATTTALEDSKAANLRAALTALPANAPLWEYTPFLEARDQTIVHDAHERIRTLAHRQADAETMLARGDFPLAHLGTFALDLTPSICEKARALLRKRVEPLIPAAPGTKPYSAVEPEVRAALPAMNWLVGYGCALDRESLAWENMAKAYRNPNYDVTLLAGLREPGQLGKRLREDPERFSQLNAQSHLKAWLKFTDQAEMLEKVIAGVRTLPRRTADAVEFLNDKYAETSWFRLFRILPMIDLEATPALCAAAAKVLGPEFMRTYRPNADDPRRYSELVDRLGVGRPLSSLVWLAGRGCAMDKELAAADELVRTYQDSPGRAEMLATIARLRVK